MSEELAKAVGETEIGNIGEIAGNIWKYLEEFGDSTTFQLKVSLAISNSKLFLALGWLFRENKIALKPLDKGFKVQKIG